MKSLSLLIIALFCIGQLATAQTNYLQNGGFETWTTNLPASWRTDTSSCKRSTVVHGGASAARLGNYVLLGVIAFPGSMSQDVPVSGSTFSIKGWYQLIADSGDGFLTSVFASNKGAFVGAGTDNRYGKRSTYTAFATGVGLLPNTTADTCSVMFMMIADTSGNLHMGAYVLLDDLVLDNTVTGVKANEFALPSRYELLQNYPNPFNPATEIEFTLPQEQRVTLKIYNVMGQLVQTLVDETLPQGRYKKSFDGSGLASGMYLYRLEAGRYSEVKKMILMK